MRLFVFSVRTTRRHDVGVPSLNTIKRRAKIWGLLAGKRSIELTAAVCSPLWMITALGFRYGAHGRAWGPCGATDIRILDWHYISRIQQPPARSQCIMRTPLHNRSWRKRTVGPMHALYVREVSPGEIPLILGSRKMLSGRDAGCRVGTRTLLLFLVASRLEESVVIGIYLWSCVVVRPARLVHHFKRNPYRWILIPSL